MSEVCWTEFWQHIRNPLTQNLVASFYRGVMDFKKLSSLDNPAINLLEILLDTMGTKFIVSLILWDWIVSGEEATILGTVGIFPFRDLLQWSHIYSLSLSLSKQQLILFNFNCVSFLDINDLFYGRLCLWGLGDREYEGRR